MCPPTVFHRAERASRTPLRAFPICTPLAAPAGPEVRRIKAPSPGRLQRLLARQDSSLRPGRYERDAFRQKAQKIITYRARISRMLPNGSREPLADHWPRSPRLRLVRYATAMSRRRVGRPVLRRPRSKCISTPKRSLPYGPACLGPDAVSDCDFCYRARLRHRSSCPTT